MKWMVRIGICCVALILLFWWIGSGVKTANLNLLRQNETFQEVEPLTQDASLFQRPSEETTPKTLGEPNPGISRVPDLSELNVFKVNQIANR